MTDRLARHFRHHLGALRAWDHAVSLHRHGVPLLPRLLIRRIRSRYGADLPLWRQRPPELYLMHNGLGTVIHPDTVFTGPVIVFHEVTFGNLWTAGAREGTPTIGSHVFIGAGAKILGRVTIGDHVVIGANCVVTRDIPSCTAVSVSGSRSIDPETVRQVHFAYDRIS